MADRAPMTNIFAPPWNPADETEGSMWLAWLIRLRWVAVVGQAVTLSFTVGVLEEPVWVTPALVGLIAVLGTTNLASLQLLRRGTDIGQGTLLLQLLLDVGVLTGFYMAAGGPANPFLLLYMLHISMGAVMLRPRFAAILMAVVLMANGLLHWVHLPLHPERHMLGANLLMSLGQMAGFTVTVISLGLFVLGMSRSLRTQKQTLIEARERTARVDRLRSVGTLAAGAAHELNTPLSTVLMRVQRIGRRHDDDATVADLKVVQSQLDRCVDIVQRLLFGAGDPSASQLVRAPLGELTQRTVELWSKGSPLHAELAHVDPVMVELPRVSFSQALTNLLENAREAQQEAGIDAPLQVDVRRRGEGHDAQAVLTIRDHGAGLPANPDRVGEPFFTTKPTGTGLGVFVARQVAEGVGGGLAYERRGEQTLTRWWFPTAGECP